MAELDDWQVLTGLFPSGWQDLGRSSGTVRRLRGFSSLDALLRTLLLHVGCGWSLRETAVQAKLAGLADVSDVTLLNRLRDAEDWLRGLCEQLWRANGVTLEPGFTRRRVRLLDATVVYEPGKTGSQWRIHYSLQLPGLECDQFDLTSTRGAGTGEHFGQDGYPLDSPRPKRLCFSSRFFFAGVNDWMASHRIDGHRLLRQTIKQLAPAA